MAALAVLAFAGCTVSKPPEIIPQKATLVLADGETLVGAILIRDEENIRFANEKGMVRNIPVKDVLFVQMAEQPDAEAAGKKPPAAPEPGSLEKFQAPVTGTLAI